MKNEVSENFISDYDKEIKEIADYTVNFSNFSDLSRQTAYYVLLDSIACGILALKNESCKNLLGPVFGGSNIDGGARVFGTNFTLDPIRAAWNTGCIIRWLDFNDTWLAEEWGHPSDNLGAILPLTDFLSLKRVSKGQDPIKVSELIEYTIKAHEIQGVLALDNSFNKVGLDHVLLVRVASSALSSYLLGGDFEDVCNTVSHAWVDGSSLRTYRHAPNTGSRKSWAAGDATSRAVRLAWLTTKGEGGYRGALSAKTWGFSDVSFKSKPIKRSQEYRSYVMENILFKISFPAEFHAQTAVEAGISLHEKYGDKLDKISSIEVETQEPAVRIISKTGPLHNYADRDHCLQYMIAIALIYGKVEAKHYQDEIASNPMIDSLREKMIISENTKFSRDYLDPSKRSIANSITLVFDDGAKSEKITVEYPVGHRNRREEGIPLLINKFKDAIKSYYPGNQSDDILNSFLDMENLSNMSVNEMMDKLIIK
ncbi:MAG: bifunctional 2-methylcitrate dehydratase/aconitate hydratase [Cytophagales bacterium]